MFSALRKAPLHDLASTDANGQPFHRLHRASVLVKDFISGTSDNPETPCWVPYLSEALTLMEKKVQCLQTGLVFMSKLLIYSWNKVYA